MSHRISTTRSEPVRTRKVSKSEMKRQGMGDIQVAFKMAADKKSQNIQEELVATKPGNKNEQEQEQIIDKVVNSSSRKGIEVATQVTPIELEIVQEATTMKNIGVSVDTDKEQILEAIRELTEKFDKLDDVVNHPKKGVSAQITSLMLKGDNLHTDMHGDSETEGILDKISSMQANIDVTQETVKQVTSNQDRLTKMLAENKRLSQDLLTTQGLLQKYNQKIQVLEQKVLDLTRRGMEQNLVFHAIEEAPDPSAEDCYDTVAAFIQNFFGFEIDEADVWKAYRIGKPRVNRARPLFTKLSYYAKDRIMDKVGVLKGKKNVHGQVRFVAEQIPDGIVENRKFLGKEAAMIKKVEDKKPQEQQRPVRIMGNKIVVGGEVYKQEVVTPQPMDLFPSVEEQKRINIMAKQLKEAQPLYSYNSTFVGLAVPTKTIQEVQLAYKAVMQRFPYMDHVMMAYEIKSDDSKNIKYGSCDDNEHGGGEVLRKLIYNKKADNITLFVVRRYGGIHLGMDRFNMIEKAADEAYKLLRPQA